MDDIYSLVKLLQNAAPKNKFTYEENSLYGKFYNSLINQKIKSDQDAIKVLYGSKSKISKYYTLKKRFYDEVINEIQQLSPNELSNVPRTNARLRVLDGLKLYSILDSGITPKNKIKYLKIILKESIKTEDITLMLEIALNLYELYAIWVPVPKQEKYYLDLVEEYNRYYNEKVEASKVYSYYAKIILTKKNLNKFEIDTSISNILSSLNHSTNIDYKTRLYIFSSRYYHFLIKSNIIEITKCCNEALEYFDNRKEFIAGGYYSFLIKTAFVHMYNSSYTKALNLLNRTPIRNISRTSLVWLNINMYAIKNLIYLSEYKEAMIKLIDVTRHSSYEKIKTPYFTEIFKIKEAYLNVLLKMKKFELESEGILKKKPFRINKFLNEVPNYSKDKRGSNISILIIHVFYLLINKNYDLILNRLESLKAYSHRYLRNDDSLRSNAFIKILLQLPSSNYNPIALKRNAGKYYHKMINAPVHIAARHIEVEVIPYEKQYELLTDLLNMRLNKQI